MARARAMARTKDRPRLRARAMVSSRARARAWESVFTFKCLNRFCRRTKFNVTFTLEFRQFWNGWNGYNVQCDQRIR